MIFQISSHKRIPNKGTSSISGGNIIKHAEGSFGAPKRAVLGDEEATDVWISMEGERDGVGVELLEVTER